MNTIQGNLITMFKNGDFDYIAHGCNTQGIMGAGIAAQIAKELPMAKYADLKYKKAMKDLFGDEHDKLMLGTLSSAEYQKGTVLNLYTQIQTGPDFRLLEGLYCALSKIVVAYKRESPLDPKKKIGFPKIGAGIGGGKWQDIESYISTLLTPDFEVTIVEYVDANAQAPVKGKLVAG